MTSMPGALLSWDFTKVTPEDIKSRTKTLIEATTALVDSVGQLREDELSFATVIQPLAEAECIQQTEGSFLDFPQHAATDKSLRDASTEAEKELEDFRVEMSMRKDVFEKLVQFQKAGDTKNFSPEGKRLLQRLIKMGERNGLHLPDEVQEKIKTIKKRISELCIDFQKNLNEDNTFLLFSREELLGMPDDFLDSLEKDEDGKLKVTMKYPHFFPVTRKCKLPETRRKVETAYQSRCLKVNTLNLEELIKLRQQQADILGYANHAAYVQEMRMAKDPKTVEEFLNELSEKLQPLWQKEKQVLLHLKEQECKENGWEYNGTLNFWDMRYYTNMVEEKEYSVDQQALKEYFPLERVTEGLLDIYQQMLSLVFTPVPDAPKWHPDVEVYRVNDKDTGELLGYFYLDLFPREGKYGHAAVFTLQPGCVVSYNSDQKEGKKRQVCIAAMMANFTKPTASKPSLLDHKEVETYFHEFGHVMHTICAKAEFALFAGCHTEQDFVEAPSQMLENWVWENEALVRMSGHHVNKSSLPEDMMEQLVKSRKANAGAFNLRQIVLATFDQLCHTRAEADTQSLFRETYQNVMGIATIPDTNMPANFGHLAGGYDAQYYGYLWSEVFSMDMFESKFKLEGIMNPKVGMEYRKLILEPGGTRDGWDMLKDFLGRKPTPEAFLRSKGL